jgi:hypothetical protein
MSNLSVLSSTHPRIPSLYREVSNSHISDTFQAFSRNSFPQAKLVGQKTSVLIFSVLVSVLGRPVVDACMRWRACNSPFELQQHFNLVSREERGSCSRILLESINTFRFDYRG